MPRGDRDPPSRSTRNWMQQFREKFLLLSHYLHDVFGAGTGEDVTIVRTSSGATLLQFFSRPVSVNGHGACCGVSRVGGFREIVMREGRFDIPRKFAALLGIGLTAGLVAGTGAWQRRPAGADQATSKASTPTFYRDVLPILQSHCQNCHRPGEVAPMPLVTYAQTKPWAPGMAAEVAMKIDRKSVV